MEKKLEPKVGTASTPKKLSYEELENACHQLSAQAQQLNAQNQQLRVALNEANLTNLYKRLDYLFKVVENGHMFKQDFLEKCIAEIEEIMTVPEEVEEEETPDIKTED